MADDDFEYLSVDDIVVLHETIVAASDETEPGIQSRGDIEYAVAAVQERYFGEGPGTLDEKAAELLRLLTVNHPFVDGNKRTALVSTVAFYALNGYSVEYGDEVRSLLKRLATDQTAVPTEEVVEYLQSRTVELPEDKRTRYRAFLSVGSDHPSERNDYTDNEST